MTTDTGRPLATTIAGQHARIRTLFAEVTDAALEGRGARFAELARYLAIHEAAERTFLHRTDADHGDPDGTADVGQQRVAEEQEASLVLARLEQLGAGDQYFLIQLGLLEEAVQEHAAREENDELPLLETALTSDALLAVRNGMERVDELFADRAAGAAVPVDGGFSTQYDAARMALSRTAGSAPRA